MWHVSSRSGVATLRTAIHLLLTCLLLTSIRRWCRQEACDIRPHFPLFFTKYTPISFPAYGPGGVGKKRVSSATRRPYSASRPETGRSGIIAARHQRVLSARKARQQQQQQQPAAADDDERTRAAGSSNTENRLSAVYGPRGDRIA